MCSPHVWPDQFFGPRPLFSHILICLSTHHSHLSSPATGLMGILLCLLMTTHSTNSPQLFPQWLRMEVWPLNRPLLYRWPSTFPGFKQVYPSHVWSGPILGARPLIRHPQFYISPCPILSCLWTHLIHPNSPFTDLTGIFLCLLTSHSTNRPQLFPQWPRLEICPPHVWPGPVLGARPIFCHLQIYISLHTTFSSPQPIKCSQLSP